MKRLTRAAWVLVLLALVGAGSGVAAVWTVANGLSLASAVLCGVPIGAGAALAAFGAGRPARRWLRALAGVSLAAALAYGLMRLSQPTDGLAAALCHEADCAPRRFALARLVPEEESVRAGLVLALAAGITSFDERASYDRTVKQAWATLPDRWRLPNAGLQFSRPGAVTVLRFDPPQPPRGCIVFLHGFGGMLTPYVRALAESPLGDHVIVAPMLDPEGWWKGQPGEAVVQRSLALASSGLTGPAGRCWLIGLSNGAIAALEWASSPRLAGSVRGVVLLSGMAKADGPIEVPTRVVLGSRDARMRIDWTLPKATALREANPTRLTVRTFDADHFLVLSHAEEWTTDVAQWIAAQR